jgi:hypothetical protein
MSATHKRLLPESDRIPYSRNPSNPATSLCAAGLPTDRGELPVFVSLSAPPVLTRVRTVPVARRRECEVAPCPRSPGR